MSTSKSKATAAVSGAQYEVRSYYSNKGQRMVHKVWNTVTGRAYVTGLQSREQAQMIADEQNAASKA